MSETMTRFITGGQFLVEPITEAKVYSREDFTEEHRDIYNMVMEFDRERILTQKEEIEKFNPDLIKSLIKEMGELGLLGIDVPEEYGGLDLDKITAVSYTHLTLPTKRIV